MSGTRHGQPIPGGTVAQQFAVVSGWHEQAIGARAGSPGWLERLEDALTAFRDLRWPLDYLQQPGPGP